MSTRYECISASYCSVSIAKAGHVLGECPVDPGNIAVVFNYDEVVYLEGTPEEVVELLMTAINKVVPHLSPRPVLVEDSVIRVDLSEES